MMMQDSCIICKKPLFGEKGKRLTDECYSLYLLRKRADKHGTYSDASKGYVFLCPDCLKKRNGSSILGILIEQKEHSDGIEKIETKGDWYAE